MEGRSAEVTEVAPQMRPSQRLDFAEIAGGLCGFQILFSTTLLRETGADSLVVQAFFSWHSDFVADCHVLLFVSPHTMAHACHLLPVPVCCVHEFLIAHPPHPSLHRPLPLATCHSQSPCQNASLANCTVNSGKGASRRPHENIRKISTSMSQNYLHDILY